MLTASGKRRSSGWAPPFLALALCGCGPGVSPSASLYLDWHLTLDAGADAATSDAGGDPVSVDASTDAGSADAGPSTSCADYGGQPTPWTTGPCCDLTHYRCTGGLVCILDLSTSCAAVPYETGGVYEATVGTCHAIASSNEPSGSCTSEDDCDFTDICGADGMCHSQPCFTPGTECPDGCVNYLQPHWCGPLPCLCLFCPGPDAGTDWAPPLVSPIDNP